MYSLVVPVYRNASTIHALCDRVQHLYDSLDHALDAVFVVDGSPDQSADLLRAELAQRTFPSQLVILSRNFGSFAAIRMGLRVAKGHYFAVMAADLQEPAELIVQFFRALSDEPVDITLSVRTARSDPRASKFLSRLFWAVYRRLIQPDVPPGGIDVFGCNAAVRDQLLAFNESNSSLVGLLVWLGFRKKVIPYERMPRHSDKSSWTLRRKLRYMLDSTYSFTDLPITFLTITGGLGSVLASIVGIIVFLAWLSGAVEVSGYAPVILTLLLSTSLILLALGVIGGYVWRAYENTKNRPLFIPLSIEQFHGDHKS